VLDVLLHGWINMTRAGIFGFGLAGRYFHAPLLAAAGIDIRGVVSRQLDYVHTVVPQARVHERDADLLARPDIDLVVIATPNHLHVEQARAALLAGKHVVVDKPLSLHASQVDELMALASERGRMLAVFHNRRWDADFLTIRRLMQENRVGRLSAFHARWDRFRPVVADRWREHEIEGNGVLYDLGAHLIDQTLCLFGTPDWIQADVFTQRSRAVASDGFELLLAKGTARITLGVSTLAAEGGPRYRVHGAQGSYVKSGLDVQEPQLRAGMLASDASFGVEPQSQWGTFTDGASGERHVIPSESGQWTQFYKQVRTCIERGGPPPVSASDGREVIRIIEAALQSSETGRRVTL
jgi:scyllo-inositol 2-dehydrogenase (NADP+)